MTAIASAGLAAWQAVVLIILSFGSLVIALYCLLFMVPLKKFVQRIESLGGGMEGIKNHLSGVEAHFDGELRRIESSQADRIDHISAEAARRVETVEQEVREAMNAASRLGNMCHTLEESLKEMQEQLKLGADRSAGIEGRLRELRRDMSVQAEETEGKLQNEVKESFYELEATILATLEVLRDELLPPKKELSVRDPGAVFSPSSQKKTRHRDDQEPPDNKIISAGPLFARPETPKRDRADDGGGDEEEDPS